MSGKPFKKYQLEARSILKQGYQVTQPLVSFGPPPLRSSRLALPGLLHALFCDDLPVCPVCPHLDHHLILLAAWRHLPLPTFTFPQPPALVCYLLSPPTQCFASTFLHLLSPVSAAVCSCLCPLIALSGTHCLAICSCLYLLLPTPAVALTYTCARCSLSLMPAVAVRSRLCPLAALIYACTHCLVLPMPALAVRSRLCRLSLFALVFARTHCVLSPMPMFAFHSLASTCSYLLFGVYPGYLYLLTPASCSPYVLAAS